jgi:hypothetical protein
MDMEPVLFVMAILGCSDDGGDCRQQRIEPVRYGTIAACQAAVPQALRRNTDVDFPVVGAQCQTLGQHVVEQRPVSAKSGG